MCIHSIVSYSDNLEQGNASSSQYLESESPSINIDKVSWRTNSQPGSTITTKRMVEKEDALDSERRS